MHQKKSKLCKKTNRILEWYHNGESTRSIANRLDVSHKPVRRLLNDFGVTRDSSEANKVAWDNGRFGRPNPDLCEDEDLAWLVSVLVCDGSVFSTESNEYIIGLCVIDKEFKNRFTRILEGRDLTVSEHVGERNGKPMYNVRANSKQFYQWWTDYTIEDKKCLARSHPREFVKGCYDSEGGLSYAKTVDRWCISITNQKDWLLETCLDIISEETELEFNGIYRKGNCGVIELNGKQAIQDFCSWVKPTISRKNIKIKEGQ